MKWSSRISFYLLEEHEVHDRVGLVVLGQLGVQGLAQHIVAGDGCVYGLVIGIGHHEAAIQQGLRLQLRLPCKARSSKKALQMTV